ncbi:MAG: ribosome-associated translation inhibitor RaiA [Alphaproteobacteria bacterium]|jgi:ribosomal subunit interface protein|nr:ribosome-associated translation inhibitor RaiA [Alphaproteobacteria bacterium]
MTIVVKGKHLDITEALRQHVNDRLKNVYEKFFGEAIDTTVTVSQEGHLFLTHISSHVSRSILVQSDAKADTAYVAVDMACENLGKQLRKYKQRLQDHRRRKVTVEPAWYSVLSPEEDEANHQSPTNASPVIVAEMEAKIDTLTVSEAVMRLDLAKISALMFRNQSHGQLNMVYRRIDGNIGWIDPEGNKKLASVPARSSNTKKS